MSVLQTKRWVYYKQIVDVLKDSQLAQWRTIDNIFNLIWRIRSKYEDHLWARYRGGIVELPDFKMYLDWKEQGVSKSIFLHKMRHG